MFELPSGRIKMTQEEIDCYRHYSGRMAIPQFKAEFTASLIEAAAAMRARISSGNPRHNDSEIGAELIEDFLANPHMAEAEARRQAWIDAGCPMGEVDMRKAGLSSPALDRLQREREALRPSEGSSLPMA